MSFTSKNWASLHRDSQISLYRSKAKSQLEAQVTNALLSLRSQDISRERGKELAANTILYKPKFILDNPAHTQSPKQSVRKLLIFSVAAEKLK